MPELKSFEDQIRDLYHFFVSAELNNEEVTYEQIQERLVNRKYDTLVWYANNFWTWFLSKKKEKRGRYRVFVCHDLALYPEAFFLAAHLNSQGKYFYHFGRALDDSRERARMRKQLKEQEGLPQPDLPEPPTEVGQEFPEELHFADNETEEMEGSEPDEIIVHTLAAAILREPAPFVAPILTPEKPIPERLPSDLQTRETLPTEDASINGARLGPEALTIKERITEMLDFSRKNRTALDQLRLTVETLVQTLVQERDQQLHEISGELQTLKKTLDVHTQQTSLAYAEWSQLHNDVVGQVQAVQQTLVKEQEQLRKDFASKIEMLAQEIHQSRTPPDFSPIYAALASQIDHVEQILTAVIKQSAVPPDLASIRSELESSSEHLQHVLLTEFRKSPVIPELRQITTDVTKIQQHVSDLASLVSQLAQNSPVSSHGHVRPLQTSIQAASAYAQQAITTLENEYRAWLERFQHQLETIQQGHDETGKYLQTIQAYASPNGEPQDTAVIQEEEENMLE